MPILYFVVSSHIQKVAPHLDRPSRLGLCPWSERGRDHQRRTRTHIVTKDHLDALLQPRRLLDLPLGGARPAGPRARACPGTVTVRSRPAQRRGLGPRAREVCARRGGVERGSRRGGRAAGLGSGPLDRPEALHARRRRGRRAETLAIVFRRRRRPLRALADVAENTGALDEGTHRVAAVAVAVAVRADRACAVSRRARTFGGPTAPVDRLQGARDVERVARTAATVAEDKGGDEDGEDDARDEDAQDEDCVGVGVAG